MKKSFALRVILLLVLLTSASLACKGGSLPSLFATATPTYTITPSPTATQPPTATLPPSSTPNPSGINLETQADGFELFTDSQARFSLLIPPAWVGVPANVDDISPYIEQASENNPQFEESLSMLNNMDPNILRIIAMDTTTEHYANGYMPNFSVLTMQDPLSAKMPLDKVVQMTGSSITSQYPEARLLNSGITELNDGFSYGYNELLLPINTVNNSALKVFQKQVYFAVDTYFVIITMTAPQSTYEDVLTEFNEIMSTIQVLAP